MTAPFGILEWDDEDRLNDDYLDGKHRNFFAIIFARGSRAPKFRYILQDIDANDDGRGDILGLFVYDVDGESGGTLNDAVVNSDNEPLEVPTDWGFVIYDENTFRKMRPNGLDLVPFQAYHLTDGRKTVEVDRK